MIFSDHSSTLATLPDFDILVVECGREPVGSAVFIQAGEPRPIVLPESVVHFGQFGVLTIVLEIFQDGVNAVDSLGRLDSESEVRGSAADALVERK